MKQIRVCKKCNCEVLITENNDCNFNYECTCLNCNKDMYYNDTKLVFENEVNKTKNEIIELHKEKICGWLKND